MSAASPIVSKPVVTKPGRYALVMAELPGRERATLGVLLQDPAADALYLRFRRDWETLAEDEDAEVLELLAGDLERKAAEMGAEHLFAWIEDNLSNTVTVTDRESVLVEDFSRALDRLYRKHVASHVLAFRTHLPRYTLLAAAGKFLENAEVSEDGWVEVPGVMRTLRPGMFVATIAGHSMEPLIPDGSLCVFETGVIGSRTGRLVLVEDRQMTGFNQYTVKRYRSEKSSTPDGSWRHDRIRLEALNPDYESWDLEPDQERFAMIAEFVRVLE